VKGFFVSERWARAWPPIASALLLLAAFAPVNLGLLCIVALTPWLIQLRTSDARQGWRSGYLYGVVYGLGQLAWLGAFVSRWTGSWAIGLLPYLAAVFAYAVYFGLFGWLARAAFFANKPWLIPLVWAGIEVFRSYLPVLAFPWGILASPLWLYTPLNQSAYFGSIYLVSAWCVLASTLLAMLMEGEGLRRTQPLLNALLFGLALSFVRLSTNPPTRTFTVTVGQPGVDMAFGDPATENSRLRENIQPILDDAAMNGSQLVVLPEGIADAPRLPPTVPFEPDPRLPVLFGAQRSVNPSYQSAFVFDGGYRFVDKTRLVIFGEFVPGRGLIPYPESFRLPSGDLAAGTQGVKGLKVAGTLVGPVICFEALFPDIAYRQTLNGADMLAVMSIDDWYMGTTAPDQLRAASIWRSIETGLPLVRSASLGASLATDSHGRVIAEAPLGEPKGLRVELGLPTGEPTFRFQPIFPLACLLSLVYTFWLAIRIGSPKP
jgi:apolipoprotein N-acyltransferase